MTESIVVVEDNADVRNNLKEILQSADYKVEVAENGKVGVEVIQKVKPDLIICDIMMPEMDGYEVLKTIRGISSVSSTPFIFLTAKTAREDLSKGMEMGADDYIMKPFTISELLKRVRIRLDKRKEIVRRSEAKLKDATSSIGMPITHEFNEPLKTLTGIGELITTEHYNMEKFEVVEFVTLMNKAALELKELVEKTLGFYEVEELLHNPESAEKIINERIDDSKSFINAIANSEAIAFNRANDLVISLVDSSVNISPKYFKRILSGLINNALKFSPKGSMVRVISGIDEGQLLITISDEGLGMTPEQVERIGAYRKFNDGESKGGLGLGLYNAKRIVELFGGSFHINSNKGVGTIIKIRLKA
jgi:DNA-binding response OmpR family regulator